jgi:branched-chain amino acid transport system permease protein
MKLSKRISKSFVLVGIVAFSLIFPLIVNSPYLLHKLIVSFVFIIGAEGFRLIYMVGRVSLGQSVFMAVGGYVSALMALNGGINPWLAILAGGISGVILAFLIGFPTLRVGGIYFAVITLALVELLGHVVSGSEITGSHIGLMDIPGLFITVPFIGRYDFGTSKLAYYYLMWFITALLLLVIYSLELSRIGRIFRAIRHGDTLAEHLGINPLRYRILAFCIGAFFSGLGGGITAHYMGYLGPQQFDVLAAIMIQVYAITGGLGSIVGPIVGALSISTLLEFLLGWAKEWQPLFYGAILLVVVIGLKDGLISLPSKIINALMRSKR